MVVNPWDREKFLLMYEDILDDIISIEKKHGVVFAYDGMIIKTLYLFESEKEAAAAADAELSELLMNFICEQCEHVFPQLEED